MTEQFLQGNVSLRHLLSKETQLMSWWRYAINYVNDWDLFALHIENCHFSAVWRCKYNSVVWIPWPSTLFMRKDLLGLQYSLIYLLSIRHRQCLQIENLRSKESYRTFLGYLSLGYTLGVIIYFFDCNPETSPKMPMYISCV